jgi:arylsulfatase B
MTARRIILCLLLATMSLWACTAKQKGGTGPPNFLLLISDDMGIEILSCYGVGSDAARTPNLDRLCAMGVRFNNFWSQSTGSPTRATILTGQYSFRNGDGVARDAYALPRALTDDRAAGYSTAALGKWYLADEQNGGLDHPAKIGFDHYAGSMRANGLESFFAWSEVVNGKITGGRTGYATSATVDDAVAWFDHTNTYYPDKPWLIWVAFNAPHQPLEEPPANLLSPQTVMALNEKRPAIYFKAMIEAMDTEIGRLLEAIGPDELANTYIVFLSDNGTEPSLVSAPFSSDRAKGTLYQGGINVPLVISGPGIQAGAATESLANSVDLFATILDLAGIRSESLPREAGSDAVSLAPILRDPATSVRDYAYADLVAAPGHEITSLHAIRNSRYKLIVDQNKQSDELYDLLLDPYEGSDLLQSELSADAQENYAELTRNLRRLLSGR